MGQAKGVILEGNGMEKHIRKSQSIGITGKAAINSSLK